MILISLAAQSDTIPPPDMISCSESSTLGVFQRATEPDAPVPEDDAGLSRYFRAMLVAMWVRGYAVGVLDGIAIAEPNLAEKLDRRFLIQGVLARIEELCRQKPTQSAREAAALATVEMVKRFLEPPKEHE